MTGLLFLSAAFQLAVAVVALRAPRTARTRAAWWTLAAAVGLSAARRTVVLVAHLSGAGHPPTRPLEETLAVVVSALLLAGVVGMRRLWEEADAAVADAAARDRERREDAELWQRVFEYAPDGYILIDLHGALVRLNRAAEEIAGLDRREAEGRHLLDLGILDADGLATASRNLQRIREGDDVGPSEYLLHRPDGTARRIEIKGFQIEFRGRQLMLAILRDITRRKLAEEELRRSRARLEEAQRVAGVVTFEIDLLGGGVVLSNQPPTGERLPDGRVRLGMEEAFAYIHPDDRDRMAQQLATGTAAGSGGDVVVEYRQTGLEDDRESVVRTTARAERDEDGNIVRLIGATLDVTDIRAAEKEIRDLNADLEQRVLLRTAELERAVDELEAFSYSVSHDLRSPLRAMAGYSDLVLEEDGERLSEESRGHLRRIHASSVRMGGLIDGLLSLSRLTRARRHDEAVDLSELARTVLADLRAADPSREVDLLVEEGLVVVADRAMMMLVLQNLLANAWKFTRDTPRPRIAFGRDGDGAYFVKDNGVGFDAAQSAKLFRPFERLHRTDEFEGTGIGLATVGRIIRHHGGRSWAEGAIGKGATFRFTIGAAEQAPA